MAGRACAIEQYVVGSMQAKAKTGSKAKNKDKIRNGA
jgi:hypothetical protein